MNDEDVKRYMATNCIVDITRACMGINAVVDVLCNVESSRGQAPELVGRLAGNRYGLLRAIDGLSRRIMNNAAALRDHVGSDKVLTNDDLMEWLREPEEDPLDDLDG